MRAGVIEPGAEYDAPFATKSESPDSRLGCQASPRSQARAADPMREEQAFVGIAVSKDRLDVRVRPSGESFAVLRDGAGIAELAELGRIDRRRLAALVGVAPINCNSGIMLCHRAIADGQAEVRDVLYLAALTAARRNPFIRTLYCRLR